MAVTETPNKKRQRIAVLLDHPGDGDSRVYRACRGLTDAGLEVRLFTLHRGVAKPAKPPAFLDAFSPEVVHLCEEYLYPWPLAILRKRRRNRRRMENVPRRDENLAYASNSSHISNPPSGFFHKIARAFGALYWHRGVTKAMSDAVSDFAPDVIYANDLSTLGAGVALSRSLGARLLYDAHEFEQGRNGVSNNTDEFIRRRWESRLISKADAVVTVGEGLSERLHQIYKIKRPTVVLNIPEDAENARQLTHDDVDFPKNRFLVLYVGAISVGRGIETMIDALPSIVKRIPNLVFAVASPPSPQRWEDLVRQAADLSVSDRLKRIAAVPQDQVISLIRLADVSLIPLMPTCESYRLSLPNKLFQSLFAETPIVATPLPEIATILQRYGGGGLTEGFSSSDIAAALISAKNMQSKNRLPECYSAAESTRRLTALVTALASHKPAPIAPRFDFDPAILDDSHWKPDGYGFRASIAKLAVAVMRL